MLRDPEDIVARASRGEHGCGETPAQRGRVEEDRGASADELRGFFLIETHSLPALARRYPRDFTFYVAHPIHSILNSYLVTFFALVASCVGNGDDIVRVRFLVRAEKRCASN